MKGHSCYAMCGAGAALGERAANTGRTDTKQDGQTLDGSQRPERVQTLTDPPDEAALKSPQALVYLLEVASLPA